VVHRQFREIVMLAQLGTILTVVRSAVETIFGIRFPTLAGMAVTAFALGGCMPTVPMAGADPADPAARVADVGYRSTIAPYTRLRPTTPSSWREQNDRVAPAPKSGQ
jgi:hypothetical protein